MYQDDQSKGPMFEYWLLLLNLPWKHQILLSNTFFSSLNIHVWWYFIRLASAFMYPKTMHLKIRPILVFLRREVSVGENSWSNFQFHIHHFIGSHHSAVSCTSPREGVDRYKAKVGRKTTTISTSIEPHETCLVSVLICGQFILRCTALSPNPITLKLPQRSPDYFPSLSKSNVAQ